MRAHDHWYLELQRISRDFAGQPSRNRRASMSTVWVHGISQRQDVSSPQFLCSPLFSAVLEMFG